MNYSFISKNERKQQSSNFGKKLKRINISATVIKKTQVEINLKLCSFKELLKTNLWQYLSQQRQSK